MSAVPQGTRTTARRVARAVCLLFGAAAIAAGCWLTFRVRAPLPTRHGQVLVASLTRPVELVRDTDGVMHVRAASAADACFGLGYAHAQDRLWQMEFQRRVGQGRLSELLGVRAVRVDRLFRTIGIRRSAAATLPRLSAPTRALLDAYAAGVNAFLAAHRGSRLPIEFALFGIDPEPWRPEDSVAWSKMMAWGLDGNWRSELLRARLEARIGVDRAAALMPVYTADGPVILSETEEPDQRAGQPLPPAPIPPPRNRAAARNRSCRAPPVRCSP